MRPQHTDPDIKRYDRHDEMVPCAECHGWMLPLEKYEISKLSGSPTPEAEWWEVMLWGWSAYLYNYVYDLFTYESRKRKLAQQKREILPRFPNSLVCPRCLHIVKRP